MKAHVKSPFYFQAYGRYFPFLFGTFFLFLLLVACQETTTISQTLVVTEMVTVSGEPVVVTRIVVQTVAVTATPPPIPVTREPVTLDISFNESIPNLDPQQTDSDSSLDLVENLYVGLTNYNHQTNTIEPELAKSWEVSDDGRTWTFYLRDDIYWVKPASADNHTNLWDVETVRRVTADDVAFAIQRACTRSTGTLDAFIFFVIDGCEYLYGLQTVQPADLNLLGVHPLDETTLQITLTKPASYFLTITSSPVFHPVPRDHFAEDEEKWLVPEHIWISGPYLPIPGGFTENRVVLHINPQWPIQQKGNVEIINILYQIEEGDAYDLWRSKSLDISPLPESEREDFMASNAAPKAKLFSEPTVFYIGFNFDSPVFREAAVRRALAFAVDREELIDTVLNGRAVSMVHLTPPDTVGGLPIDQVGLGYSPDDANQQMGASGFSTCKLLTPVTFLVSTSDIALRRAESLMQMWQDELGCTQEQIVIQQAQFGTLLANTRREAGTLRPDMWELGWAAYYPDAENWLGSLIQCNESENRQNRPCSDVDELIYQAGVTQDLAERQSLYRQAENLLFGRDGLYPIIPLYAPGQFVLVQSWLTYTPASFGGEQFDTYVIDAELKRLERSR